MGIDLKSPGHKKICEKLKQMGVMFFFESPCKLLGDSKSYRRIDLVVVANDRAVIVEIDGSTHRSRDQQRDDYLRDHLIRKIGQIQFVLSIQTRVKGRQKWLTGL